MTLEEVEQETVKDQTVQTAIDPITNNRWYQIKSLKTPPDKDFFQTLALVKGELSALGLILCGNRLVLPAALHKRAVNITHLGHQGIPKTKALVCSNVWFPGLDILVETTVKSCISCLATTQSIDQNEPLVITEMPQTLWTNLAADFHAP